MHCKKLTNQIIYEPVKIMLCTSSCQKNLKPVKVAKTCQNNAKPVKVKKNCQNDKIIAK